MPSQAVVVSPERAKELLRFGWALAELRGRIFLGDADPGRLVLEKSNRTWHMPPLGEERSAAELIEAKYLVKQLADDSGLDISGRSMADASRHTPVAACTAVDRALQLAD